MNLPGAAPATPDERLRAVAAGIPAPDDVPCWTVRDATGAALAFVVLLPGEGERCVRAVAAGDPADPVVAEAVVAAREAVLAELGYEARRGGNG